MISEESYKAAQEFGVHLEQDKENIQPFLTVFLRRLLHQREKIERRLLDNKLPASVKDSWQRILSLLEGKNRKLLDVKSGSLNFILFCPSEESFVQLKEQQWKNDTEQALLALLDKIGKNGSQKSLSSEMYLSIKSDTPLVLRQYS